MDSEKTKKELLTEIKELRAEVERLRNTERKCQLTMKVLRDNESRYQMFVKSANDAIFFADAESGEIVGVNRKAEELIGLPAGELIGLQQANLHPPELRETYMEMFRSHAKGGGLVEEVLVRRANGVDVPVEISASVQNVGGERLVQGIFRDISKRKKAEGELKENRELLLKIIDLTPHRMYAKNEAGNFIFVNQAMAEAHGVGSREMVGRHQREFSGRGEELDDFLKDDREVIESGEAKTINEEAHTDCRGEKHLLRTTKVPFQIPGGGGRAVMGISIDVTDVTRLEDQLRQAQKMESIGRLASGVAHDLNNLLVPMVGYTDLALNNIPEDSSAREDFQHVRDSVDRVRILAQQLLAFSSKQVLNMVPVNLNEIIRGFEGMLKLAIREDIELNLHLNPELGYVNADAAQIEQIIMNLMVNARDAMPDGGKIHLSTVNKTVSDDFALQAPALHSGQYVTITVSDTGEGMGKKVQHHLFEPFFTTKGDVDERKGTGLGLSTVHGIVKQHSGHIEVESSVGEGTTFTMYFPVIEDGPGRARRYSKEEDASEENLQGAETVLVVEDDKMVLNLVENVLTQRGYEVFTADDGESALEIFARTGDRVDLLLTDVVMPAMNGKTLFEKMAAKQKDLKVVFMSGYTHDMVGHHDVKNPGMAFIQKPFSVDEILHLARRVLDHRQA